MQRILIVEDDGVVASHVARQLAELHFAVAGIASTGAEAETLACCCNPDAILINANLQGPDDGIDVARKILLRRQIPVIFLTAHGSNEMLERLTEVAPYGYVPKPVDKRVLQFALDVALTRFAMNRALADREAFASELISSMPDAVIATDERGRIRFLNAPALQLLGWVEADVIGQPLAQRINIRCAAAERTAWRSPPHVLTLDNGIEMPVEVRRTKLAEGRGPVGELLILRNLQRDMRALDMHCLLAEVSARLNEKLLTLPPVCDALNLVVPFVADAFALIVSRDCADEAELITVTDQSLDRRAVLQAGLVRMSDETMSSTGFAELSGEANFEAFLALPLESQDCKRGTLIFFSEAGGRYDNFFVRSLAEELARRVCAALDRIALVRQARVTVRAQAKTLAVVSHDLKSMLAGISIDGSAIANLQQKGGMDPRIAGRSARVVKVSNRMRQLIDDLLDYGSIENGTFRVSMGECPVIDLLLEAQDTISAITHAKGLQVKILDRSNKAAVLADPQRVLQVLMNFLSNAVKFAPEGSTLSLSAADDGQDILLGVHDEGPGLPADALERAFELYWQAADAPATGKGLGLYIAKSIVTAHGGRVWLENRPEGGASAFFTLQRAAVNACAKVS